MQDPFATTSTTDEAQSAPEPTYDIDAPTGTPIKVNPLIVPASEGKITVTLKGGSGFDAPWIVGHFSDVDDALRVFTEDGEKVADLMTRVQNAGQVFTGMAPVKSKPGDLVNIYNTQNRSAAPQGATEPPPGAPEAPGPDWVFKSGVSAKTGKAWKGWMPPRGSDASPVFFN